MFIYSFRRLFIELTITFDFYKIPNKFNCGHSDFRFNYDSVVFASFGLRRKNKKHCGLRCREDGGHVGRNADGNWQRRSKEEDERRQEGTGVGKYPPAATMPSLGAAAAVTDGASDARKTSVDFVLSHRHGMKKTREYNKGKSKTDGKGGTVLWSRGSNILEA